MSNKNISSSFSFFRDNILFTSAQFYFSFSLLIVGIVTARLLSPEGRGLYALFFTLTGLISNFLHVGFYQSTVYFLNRSKILEGNLFSNLVSLHLFILFLLGGISLFLISTGLFPNDTFSDSRYIFLLIASAMTLLVEQSFSGFILGRHFYRFYAFFIFLHSSLLLTSCFSLYFLTISLDTAIQLRILGSFFFISLFILFGYLKLNIRPIGFSFTVLKKQINFGYKSWLQNLMGFFNYRGYFLVVALFLDPKQMGLFSVSFLFVEAVRFLPNSLSTLILPRLVQKESKGNRSLVAAYANRIIFFITFIIFIVLVSVLQLLLPFIFGEEYREAITGTYFLLAGSVFGSIYQVLTRFFTSENKQIYSIISSILGLVTGISISILLVNQYGIIGVSFAYLVATILSATFMIFYFLKQTGLSFISSIILKRRDINFIINMIMDLKK